MYDILLISQAVVSSTGDELFIFGGISEIGFCEAKILRIKISETEGEFYEINKSIIS